MADMGMTEVDMNVEVTKAPPRPTRLETVLSKTTLKAGETVKVSCQWFDQYGEEMSLMQLGEDASFDIRRTPTGAMDEEVVDMAPANEFTFMAKRAGQVAVACGSNRGGVVDDTPTTITIDPGVPHTVLTTLDRRSVTAGETAKATCEVFDAFGNRVVGVDPPVTTNVQGTSVTVTGNDVQVTQTGIFTVSCHIDGVPDERGAELEVTPGLPANIMMMAEPNQNVYGLAQVITAATTVTDQYDNLIPHPNVSFSNDSGGEVFGAGRYRFHEEGMHTIKATVEGPTYDMRQLEASITVLINGTGPTINCTGPTNGAQVNQAPGSTVTFTGKVADVNGVDTLVVNNMAVTPEADGTFSFPITARYGVNFVDISARDMYGAENSKTCAFQLADRWAKENKKVSNGLSLKLRQSAVDDNVTTDGLDSLNDILLTVLNSAGLETTISDALLANNPLKNSCDVDTFLGCIFRSRIDFQESAINKPNRGPHTTSIQLVNDGLKLTAKLNNFWLKLKISGTVGTTGWVKFQYVEVKLTSDLKLVNGRPRVTLRGVDSVSVGTIDTDFSGFTGTIVDIVASFIQGTLKNMVRDLIRDTVQQQFNAALDSILGGLDVNSLGTSLNVPRLDGTGDIQLGFNAYFDSLSVTGSRALFGIGSKFSGPITRAGSTRGAPMPGGDTLLDVTTSKPIAAAIHAGVINQALHALWRAQFFDAQITGDTLAGDLPTGSRIDLSMGLPPMLVLKGNKKVEMHLGAARVGIVYPGVFDDPLVVDLGAVGQTGIIINGDQLQFTNIQLTELYFSPVDVSLDATSRDILENFLRSLVQGLLDRSLNNALPSLPIPSFELPPSMAQYGLPAGGELGIKNPALSNSTTHYKLDGAFGIR